MLRGGGGDAARDLLEYRIAQKGSHRRGIVLLNAALHQKESHFRALQEHLELEARILRADAVDDGPQRGRERCGGQ